MREATHKYKREIKCPYCNYEFQDSWEFDVDRDYTECEECEREFYYERNIEVTYSSFKE